MPSYLLVYLCLFLHVSVHFAPLFVGQITEVRRYTVAATGHCEGGSGHCGKEGSGESDSLPARYWSNLGPSATSLSTSPIGCQLLLVWREGAPTVQSNWTGSTCGTQSGELGCCTEFTAWVIPALGFWQPALSLCLFPILPPCALAPTPSACLPDPASFFL